MAPTREIALQGSEAVAAVGAALPPPGLACGTFIGGLPSEEDERQLRRSCHVAVGTPGRLLSLLQRGALVAQDLRMVVLDEADKLLAGGWVGGRVGELVQVTPRSWARAHDAAAVGARRPVLACR